MTPEEQIDEEALAAEFLDDARRSKVRIYLVAAIVCGLVGITSLLIYFTSSNDTQERNAKAGFFDMKEEEPPKLPALLGAGILVAGAICGYKSLRIARGKDKD